MSNKIGHPDDPLDFHMCHTAIQVILLLPLHWIRITSHETRVQIHMQLQKTTLLLQAIHSQTRQM